MRGTCASSAWYFNHTPSPVSQPPRSHAGNPLFQEVARHAPIMRNSASAVQLVVLLVMVSLAPLATTGQARSVHSTSVVDLFPQGNMAEPTAWSVGAETSFTQESATYTETMVADQRLTMLHQRPVHLDTMTVWSATSPTNSNYSVGAPDGASTWSTGPEIELTGFDVTGLETYEISEIHFRGVFQIPDALQEDTVRISVQHTEGFDLLKTFAHTQGNVDYINNSAFSVNITGLMEWTWSDVESMLFTLDYVSAGGVDDSRLVVDAIGLDITVQTPWYGGEVGFATTTFSGHELPVLEMDLSTGTTSNLALDDCGLTPSVVGTSGQWTSDLLFHPPDQTLGRVHVSTSEGGSSDIDVEYATSNDGSTVGEFSLLTPGTLLPQAAAYKLRLTVTEACVDQLWVDVNDPSIGLSGRIFGTNDGIDDEYSRWLLFVNDELVSNEPMSVGTFTHQWPIGGYLEPGATSFTVSLRAWFTWDSDGSESHTALEITSMSVTGGYAIQWDEDPMCEAIGDQMLTEDNGGIILPLIRRCSDDRTSNDDLIVQFTNSNEDLVAVDLAEGDVRIRLLPEANGQSEIGVVVLDAAGNTWNSAFTVVVEPVDDLPDLAEFQSLIPVERDVTTVINVTWSDIDSTQVTASTNRSWATVDLQSNALSVTPPVVGFHSVLLSVCDQSGCTEREVDLEVMALADLTVESIDFGTDELTQGDVISMRVLVRNQGYAEATMVSVRCQTEDQLIAIATIPIINPGELRAVTCDWQIPEDVRVLRFNATVDYGLEIDEGDDSNNMLEQLMAISERPIQDAAGAGDALSSTAVWIGVVAIAIGVLTFLKFAMPPKIKKIE